MSTEETAVEETAEKKGANISEIAEGFARMFEGLVPPDDVLVTDAAGNQHRLRGSVAARAQIRIMRELQSVTQAFYGLQGDRPLMAALIDLATDERVADALARAFEVAHPQQTHAAIAAVMGSSEPSDPGFIPNALDAFGIEEIVAGLVPFFVRPVARARELMTSMTTAAK